MLKIKNNIDLKELEKFGFEEYKLDYEINRGNTYVIRIDKQSRKIEINCYENYNIIYDLIKANLVEKE